MNAPQPSNVPTTTALRPAGKAWKLLRAAAAHDSSLALVDQAIVSGTSFATTVIVGRAAGFEGLGLYSLGFTIVLLCIGLLDALVTQPFTVLLHRAPERLRSALFGGALLWLFALAAVASVTLAIVTPIIAFGLTKPRGLWPVLGVLAVSISLIMLREFARKISFARLELRTALIIDAAASLLQLAGLLAAAALGWLSPANAQLIVGLACGIAGLVWLIGGRQFATVGKRGVRASARQHWPLGKWLLAGQLTWIAHGYFVQWLLAFTLSPEATGIYAACLMVIMLSNPFVIGVGNYLVPRIAQVFALEGPLALRRIVTRSTLGMMAVMGLFCGVLAVWGEPLLEMVFGAEAQGYQLLINLLSLAVLASTLSMPANAALLAVQRADLAFRAGLVGAIVNLVIALAAISTFGVFGAAAAFLAGNVAGTVLRLFMLVQVLQEQSGAPAQRESGSHGAFDTTTQAIQAAAPTQLVECNSP